MSRPAYFDKYPTIAFERDELGILVMRFHSNIGPAKYTLQHHADWTGAFYDVGTDRDNSVVIITGTSDILYALSRSTLSTERLGE